MSKTEITGKTIASGMFWRFGEKITAQFVSFLVSIVLARILLPADYGIVAIVNVFLTIAEVFVTSGLGTALVQKKDATKKDFSTLFWCNLFLSFCLYIVVFVFSPFIARFFNMSLLSTVLRVVAIRIPISAFNSIQNAYVSKNLEFKKFFFATIVGTIISAFVGILMALKGFGVWALVSQMLTNSIIDTLVLFITIKWKPSLEFSLRDAKSMVRYGSGVLATDLIGTIYNNLNDFVIGKKYTSVDLAFYSQGKKIPEMLNNNIEATLCSVLFPVMSMSDNTNQIKKIRRRSIKMMGFIIFPIMLGMAAISDKMIVVLLTEKWVMAVPYVRIACVASCINVMGTTLLQEIKAIGRSDVTLKLEFIKKPLFLIILLIAMSIGVKAIAFTVIINSVLAFCINVYPVKKYIGFDFFTHIRDLLPSFFASTFMCIVVFLLGKVITNNIVCVVVQVLLGAAIYISLSVLTKNDSFIFIKKMIISKVIGK